MFLFIDFSIAKVYSLCRFYGVRHERLSGGNYRTTRTYVFAGVIGTLNRDLGSDAKPPRKALIIKDLRKCAGHFCKCLIVKRLRFIVENGDNRRELFEHPINHPLTKRVGMASAEEKLPLVHCYVRTIGPCFRARARGRHGEASFSELVCFVESEGCFHWRDNTYSELK